jgi:hypothetical protein
MLVERLLEGVRGNRRPPDQGQGERLSDVPVSGRLSQALASREWKGIHHRSVHPSWQRADPADCRGAESGFGVKKAAAGTTLR